MSEEKEETKKVNRLKDYRLIGHGIIASLAFLALCIWSKDIVPILKLFSLGLVAYFVFHAVNIFKKKKNGIEITKEDIPIIVRLFTDVSLNNKRDEEKKINNKVYEQLSKLRKELTEYKKDHSEITDLKDIIEKLEQYKEFAEQDLANVNLELERKKKMI